jgi:hypothetical protein
MLVCERLKELSDTVNLVLYPGRLITNNLQLVLPKLLLLGLVQEREVANMMYEDISQYRELGVLRRNLALV